MQFFARRSLEGIRKPTRVRVLGRVASSNTVTTPISGLSCAVAYVRFYVNLGSAGRENPFLWPRGGGKDLDSLQDRYRLLTERTYGERLVVATDHGTIELLLATTNFRFAGGAHGTLVDRALPSELANIPEMKNAQGGLLYAREDTLGEGDRVQVIGTVAPLESDAESTTYRGAVTSSLYRAEQWALVEDLSLA